jgi:hypothetical protein
LDSFQNNQLGALLSQITAMFMPLEFRSILRIYFQKRLKFNPVAFPIQDGEGGEVVIWMLDFIGPIG